MRKGLITGTIILMVVVLAIASYLLFFYKIDCKTNTCFIDSLLNCKKASYIYETNQTINLYEILGKQDGTCEVYVKLLQIKKGSAELEILNGKDMTCTIPLKTLVMPDSDISKCHGILKENIQELVIQRLHNQIIENIGTINQSVNKIFN
jgi:hypothetical protein